MASNLNDLNNHLFETLDRLGKSDLSGEELQEELARAHAITNVAAQIVNSANLVLKAQIAKNEFTCSNQFDVPEMLTAPGDNDA